MSEVKHGHYTTQTGLLGIVGKEQLWATNIKFLNDEQEFQHALELIREVIPTSKITPGHANHKIHEQYRKAIESRLKSVDNYRSDSVFTLSFSEETDLLSQWRGYCPANNGYCVVFDVEALLEKAEEKFEEVHFVQCLYDDVEKKRRIKSLLNEHWHEYLSANGKNEQKQVADELAKKIVLLASYFKHSSFSEPEFIE